MCGRFALNYTPSKLAEYFPLSQALDFAPSWNIAPSSRICTITAGLRTSAGSAYVLNSNQTLSPVSGTNLRAITRFPCQQMHPYELVHLLVFTCHSFE
ncbi:MAG: SOS response-associated peptidase family protein [Gallionellaceae bacterium]|jgi:putative SOS response-associated peptidase YedK